MSHFAKLDENNVVIFVTVGRQEDDGKEAELCARTGERYVQTSYNTHGGLHLLGGTPLRKNYAGIGYTYDETRDAFIPPTVSLVAVERRNLPVGAACPLSDRRQLLHLGRRNDSMD